tara:strand:- start:902 stop:1612 length:711 start_codon:yes stop_codon:yes gene_type:complete
MIFDQMNIQEFYNSQLGLTVQQCITKEISTRWTDLNSTRILGVGFSSPYIKTYNKNQNNIISLLPPIPSIEFAAGNSANQELISLFHEIPLPDLSIDRIIIVHALEFSESANLMIRELWRILTDNGKILFIVPNRLGIWCRFDSNPFGFGRPYSPNQLVRLLEDNLFTTIGRNTALYMPPIKVRGMNSLSKGWEIFGRHTFPNLGGIISIEAEKQIYSGNRVFASGQKRSYAIVTS